MVSATAPIGMFDSGLGGLTVARAVIDLLPNEDLLYFGDSGRCPYGPRDPAEVRRFALEIVDYLVAEGVKLIVVACNSAESAAFYEQVGRADVVPIVTVIEPGVRAALAATTNRKIGLIGTEATIRSQAYEAAFERSKANVELVSRACPKFVEFVEAGDTTSDALIAAAEEYLTPVKDAGVDTLILGCTHYPLLSGVIQYVMGGDVVLVSSSEPTANEVYARLLEADLLDRSDEQGRVRFVVSADDPTQLELGRRFLGPEVTDLELHEWDR